MDARFNPSLASSNYVLRRSAFLYLGFFIVVRPSAIPELFVSELWFRFLLLSRVMVFFGEDKFPYMLGRLRLPCG